MTVGVWRCATVVKGGRRFSFAAMVVVGDGYGKVGFGYGKAKEVPDAVRKATSEARKKMVRVQLIGATIPHRVVGKSGAAKVILVPASPGTGVIAGEAVGSVMRAVGVRDILSKSIGGSNNKKNLVKATMNALAGLRDPSFVERLRGRSVRFITRADIGSKTAVVPAPAADAAPATEAK
ncbi:MAG: 30S ribosomal protein S5 [Planctomycetota bacterium]